MPPLLGEIRRFALSRLPDEWSPCDGSVLPITDHQPLFSLLGWRFGGDRWTTFQLPVLIPPDGAPDYGIAVNGIYPTRDDAMIEDAYVGEIRLYGGAFAPAGWLPCDGRSLPVAEPYLALYDVIGRRWGGDAEHFTLPDMRDPSGLEGTTVNGLTYMIAATGRLPRRDA
jgi:microcystin-dependent protein